MPHAPAPPGTLRIVGVVVVADGRAVDVALVESDGCEIARRLDVRRAPLDGAATAAAALLRFIGDLALQPHAIDLVAVADDADLGVLAELRETHGMHLTLADPARQWPHLPLAERVALAAARDAAQAGERSAPLHW